MKRASAILLGIGYCSLASAQYYPDRPDRTYVVDNAHLLSSSESQAITRLAKSRLQSLGAPLVVATIPSLKEMHADGIGIEAYAQRMFNVWRIGSKQDNVGILLVVSKADRKVRIEFGKRFNHEFDDDAHAIMTSTIVPAFKSGNFGSGIVAGMTRLDRLGRNPSQGQASQPSNMSSAPSYYGSSSPPMGDPTYTGEPPSFGGNVGGPGMGFANSPDSLFATASTAMVGIMCAGFGIFVFVLVMLSSRARRSRGYGYRGNFGNQSYDSRSSWQAHQDQQDAFNAGLLIGSANSSFDPTPDTSFTPTYDSGSSSSSGFDSGSSSGGFDSGSSGGFDSGSSGGGGDTGSW